jgi:hypothetical protein
MKLVIIIVIALTINRVLKNIAKWLLRLRKKYIGFAWRRDVVGDEGEFLFRAYLVIFIYYDHGIISRKKKRYWLFTDKAFRPSTHSKGLT